MSDKNMKITKLGNGYLLSSYETIVGILDETRACFVTNKKYSITTTKHESLFIQVFNGQWLEEDAFDTKLDEFLTANKGMPIYKDVCFLPSELKGLEPTHVLARVKRILEGRL